MIRIIASNGNFTILLITELISNQPLSEALLISKIRITYSRFGSQIVRFSIWPIPMS
jgi:hypothetical protein